MKFQVWNTRTNTLIGTYSTKNRARNKREKMDLIYGCYAHSIKEVENG
jgi:hypothetical protein